MRKRKYTHIKTPEEANYMTMATQATGVTKRMNFNRWFTEVYTPSKI